MEEGNQNLISFLLKKAKKSNSEKQDPIFTVIESVKLCPLVLNLEDSLDLIGVDDEIEEMLREFFSEPTDSYVPRDGSLARKMLLALHQNHPDSLSKSDILRAIGFRPIQPNGFNQHKNFFGSWASMKTLVQHGLAEKSHDKSPKYSLTHKGLELSNDLFGQIATRTINNNSSISLFVAKSELQCRVSFDVKDAVSRTQLQWKEKDLPLGSIWFIKDNQVLDFIIQFCSYSNLTSDDSIKKKISGSPFTKRVFLIPSIENSLNSSELKIKINFNYEIETVFADSIALISKYIRGVALQLEKKENCEIGNFNDVVDKCNSTKFAVNIGRVWKEQLKLIPGVGPHFAANISTRFKTPHQLIDELENNENPQEFFVDEMMNFCGKRPTKKTSDSILGLFTNTKT